MEQDDSKVYNMHNAVLLRNWIPRSTSFFRLDTHSEIVTPSTNRVLKYITNIVIVGSNHLRLYALFEEGWVEQLSETYLMDNIVSVNFLYRCILVQTDRKLIGFKYEEGRLRTTFMLSLEFLKLSPNYKSIVRIDPSLRYFIVVANNYMVLTTRFDKNYREFRKFNKCNMDILDDSVFWNSDPHHPDWAIRETLKIKLPFSDLVDVAMDCANIYFMVRQGEFISVFLFRVDSIVDQRITKTHLFYRVFQSLPANCQRLIMLNPERDHSNLMVIGSGIAIYLNQSNQQPTHQIGWNKDQPLGRIRWQSSHSIALQSAGSLFIIGVDLTKATDPVTREQVLDSSSQAMCKDFDLIKVPKLYDLRVQLLANQVVLKVNGTNKFLFSWIRSIIDFSIHKYYYLALEKPDIPNYNIIDQLYNYHSGSNNNSLLAVKRYFRPSEKITTMAKKTLIEKMSQVDRVVGMPINKLIQISTSKQIVLYHDQIDCLTKVSNIQPALLAIESEYKGNRYLALSYTDNIRIFENMQPLDVDLQHSCVSYLHIQLVDEFLVILAEEWIYVYNLFTHNEYKNQFAINIQFVKVTFSKRVYSSYCSLLMYVCFKDRLEVYQIANQTIEIKFQSQFVNQGLPYLHNHLRDKKQNKELDKTYLRSITDPNYLLDLTANLSTIPIRDMLLVESNNKKTLIFETQDRECMVYRGVTCPISEIGIAYHRTVLPAYVTRNTENKLCHYNNDIIRIGSWILYQDVYLQIGELFFSCFKMGEEYWLHTRQNKVKPADLQGEVVSGKLVQTVVKGKGYIGIETNIDFFLLYTRTTIDLIDKQLLVKKAEININEGSPLEYNIITLKTWNNFIVYSSYQHIAENESFRFYLSLIDTKLNMQVEPLMFEEPIFSIKFTRMGRVYAVTSHSIYIIQCFHNKMDIIKTFPFFHGAVQSAVGFWHSKSNATHFALTGGAFGGLTFIAFDQDKRACEEKWFDPIKCDVRDAQIFFFGKSLKTFLVDHDRNVIILDLKENCYEKLADMNIGTRTNRIIRIEQKEFQAICACMANGTIQIFTPIKLEDEDDALLHLQSKIVEHLPYPGGLNERCYRNLKQTSGTYKLPSQGNFLEQRLLDEVMCLSRGLFKAVLDKGGISEQQLRRILPRY